MVKQLVFWGYNNPRKLFLTDGLGALLSAFLLGVVLVHFEPFFGIPVPILYILALLPCLFALYDFYCLFKREAGSILLKGIAIMNSAYCLLSVGLAISAHTDLTVFGWLYLLLEVLLVLTLAIVEYKVALLLGLRESTS